VIEAAVSFGLIALGVSVWFVAHVARRVYRHRSSDRDTSFLARLFAEDKGDNPP
jgi:hypothetical protein